MGMTVLLVTERGEVLHEIGDPTSHFAPPLARRRGASKVRGGPEGL